MTEMTIKNLKKLKSFHNGSYGEDIDRAIKALEHSAKVRKVCEVSGVWDSDFIQAIFAQKGYVIEDTKTRYDEYSFNVYKYEESE